MIRNNCRIWIICTICIVILDKTHTPFVRSFMDKFMQYNIDPLAFIYHWPYFQHCTKSGSHVGFYSIAHILCFLLNPLHFIVCGIKNHHKDMFQIMLPLKSTHDGYHPSLVTYSRATKTWITKPGTYLVDLRPLYKCLKFHLKTIKIEFFMIFWKSDPEQHKMCSQIHDPDRIWIRFHTLMDNGTLHLP